MKDQIYRNLKKGTLYRVLSEAVDCTNARDGLAVVVYVSLDDPAVLYVRERTEFLLKFAALPRS